MSRRLAVLISGRGSNLQSIIDAISARRLDATLQVVVSNRADAAGLERARAAGVEALHLPPKQYAEKRYGVAVSGATVHFVTNGLDDGPIVSQVAVPVRVDDSVESLASRILSEEHRIYPEAIQLVLDGGWELRGRRFVRRS